MDADIIATLRKQAEHCHERAVGYHMDAEEAKKRAQGSRDIFERATQDEIRQSRMNDFFYWSGKATAYSGIANGLALRGIVEEELEEEGSCP